jgi:hypothetical protein
MHRMLAISSTLRVGMILLNLHVRSTHAFCVGKMLGEEFANAFVYDFLFNLSGGLTPHAYVGYTECEINVDKNVIINVIL